MTYSFVIPVKNRQTLLTHCLDSVHQQSHRAFEVIVVDYGSAEPISVPESVRLIRLEGLGWNGSVALNAGIANASGKYVVVLDCDGILASNLLAAVATQISADDRRQIYWRRFDLTETGAHAVETEGPQSLFDRGWQALVAEGLGRWHGFTSHGSFLAVRRDAIINLGGYDERMTGWGAYDDDLAKRLTAEGFPVWWGESLQLFHLPHESQLHQRESYARNRKISDDALSKGQLIRNGGPTNFDKYR